MKYDVYFHNDFDGRACAAVMLAFLRSRGDDIEHFVPVDFHLQEQWSDENFFAKHKLFKGKRNPAIVVDFPYHPRAALWFDHHITTFKKEAWKKRFKADKVHVLRPEYKSCCHLVYSALKEGFSWNSSQNIKELVKTADIIDGALYPTAKETIYLDTPAAMIEAFVDYNYENIPRAEWLVRLLADRPLSEIVRFKVIDGTIKRLREKNMKSLAYYKKNMQVFKKATFIDLTKAKVETLRYASYFLYPKKRYAIRMTIKNSNYHIGVGSSPWLKNNKVHLGKLIARYGGGGHKDAAATDMASASIADQAVIEIVKYLDHHGR